MVPSRFEPLKFYCLHANGCEMLISVRNFCDKIFLLNDFLKIKSIIELFIFFVNPVALRTAKTL